MNRRTLGELKQKYACRDPCPSRGHCLLSILIVFAVSGIWVLWSPLFRFCCSFAVHSRSIEKFPLWGDGLFRWLFRLQEGSKGFTLPINRPVPGLHHAKPHGQSWLRGPPFSLLQTPKCLNGCVAGFPVLGAGPEAHCFARVHRQPPVHGHGNSLGDMLECGQERQGPDSG